MAEQTIVLPECTPHHMGSNSFSRKLICHLLPFNLLEKYRGYLKERIQLRCFRQTEVWCHQREQISSRISDYFEVITTISIPLAIISLRHFWIVGYFLDCRGDCCSLYRFLHFLSRILKVKKTIVVLAAI